MYVYKSSISCPGVKFEMVMLETCFGKLEPSSMGRNLQEVGMGQGGTTWVGEVGVVRPSSSVLVLRAQVLQEPLTSHSCFSHSAGGAH